MFQKFSEDIIQRVWEKGQIVSGCDSNQYRKDVCGAWIERNMYGDRSSQNNYGWEIDHIKPESSGGTDDLSNLRPLQWYNNATKSDSGLTCPIR